MKALTRHKLESIEREAKTSYSCTGLSCAEHAIQDVLRETIPEYLYYDNGNEEDDLNISEIWGDLYSILNDILNNSVIE